MKPDPLEKQETVVQDEAGGQSEGVLIQDVGISPQELQEAGWDKDGVWWQPSFVPFDDRTRHLGGGSIVLEAIPSARTASGGCSDDLEELDERFFAGILYAPNHHP